MSNTHIDDIDRITFRQNETTYEDDVYHFVSLRSLEKENTSAEISQILMEMGDFLVIVHPENMRRQLRDMRQGFIQDYYEKIYQCRNNLFKFQDVVFFLNRLNVENVHDEYKQILFEEMEDTDNEIWNTMLVMLQSINSGKIKVYDSMGRSIREGRTSLRSPHYVYLEKVLECYSGNSGKTYREIIELIQPKQVQNNLKKKKLSESPVLDSKKMQEIIQKADDAYNAYSKWRRNINQFQKSLVEDWLRDKDSGFGFNSRDALLIAAILCELYESP